MEIPVVNVLIVGGGPVGLFMANELARHGVKSFRVLEKLSGINTLSKAVAVHARSLEVVPQADRFLAQGLKCGSASIYAGAKRIAHVYMDKINSEHQFALMLPQDETEQIFLDNLKDVHGITVERGYEVTSLDEFTRTSAEGKEETLVRVSAKNLTTNNDEVILARYVVGCDGARSLVRKTMKANFVGVTLNDAWLTADCQIKEDFPPANELTTVIDEKGFVAFFPLKEKERRFRIAINFGDNFTSALDKEYTLQELQDIVNERSAAMGQRVTFYNSRWISLFKLNERRVDVMRKSRLMVCGDAAHVHTPAGGQGMNTGIQDAHNLAWKLALVLKGQGKEEVLLNSFSFEREHNADNVLKNTAKMRTLISTNSKVLQALRNAILPIVSEIEAVQESMSNNMGQMDIAYPQSPLTSHYGEPRGFFKLFKSNSPSQFLGGRLPYFHLTKVADASSKFSHDIVKATTKHHVFILDDEGEHKSIEQLQTKLKANKLNDLVQIEVITNEGSHVEGVQVWRDDTKEFHKAFHLEEHSKGLAVLVRPDGYIGFISGLSTADIDAVVNHLKNYLF